MIIRIEELSMNAWPSLQTLVYGGWILRFANGCTRRANSISPIYPSTLNIDNQILECEAIYANKRLPTIFKLTRASQPPELDTLLAQNGYKEEAQTSVQLLDLSKFQCELIPDISLSHELTEEWRASFYLLNKVANNDQSTHTQILTSIIPNKCFASIRNSEGQIIACGLGVLQDKHLGLFDIVTDNNFRRKGFGKRLIQHILLWGKQNGASTSYLQVMKNNGPALTLYAKLGFREEYDYWYRVKK